MLELWPHLILKDATRVCGWQQVIIQSSEASAGQGEDFYKPSQPPRLS